MDFTQVIKQIAKANKPEAPLSRIFGYRRTNDGQMLIVEDEARVIAETIINLSTRPTDPVDEIADDLLSRFRSEGVRNRSGRPWTKTTLFQLIRPVYTGHFQTALGGWKRSAIYPPIVSLSHYRAAAKRLKGEKRA